MPCYPITIIPPSNLPHPWGAEFVPVNLSKRYRCFGHRYHSKIPLGNLCRMPSSPLSRLVVSSEIGMLLGLDSNYWTALTSDGMGNGKLGGCDGCLEV